MNTVDVILAVILLYGLIRGFFRGFFAELASLIAFIAGIYVAVYSSHILSDFLTERVTWNINFVNLIAFAITFILVVFVISLAGKLLTQVANLAMLGILNKLIGAVFGFLKVAFITSVVIMFFSATGEDINIVEEETLEDSVLYGPIRVLAPTILPSILREARELDLLEEDVEA
ncbi:CvpA family protein [Antarcticibacterium sp. 1MA-6-2]|uniref:CvpA family protein n=1 Tax=Antarcticibacterium sp. 1MA-6-2 TaxID=2908210 RepID=UPI001F421544|nr:CvpA family protein [Antarcticibacterium sp. 1MA-6-2]UJH90269.1 CvpA family protein [Antarcticibacterium sp. 1MA-6-2]